MKCLFLMVFSMVLMQSFAEETKKSKADFFKAEIKEMNLDGFHSHHVDEFAKAPGFGESRVIIMPKIVHLTHEGDKYYMTNMRLLSVTDRKKAVLWEMQSEKGESVFWGALDRTMLENKHMKKRPLNKLESASLVKLKKNKKSIVEKRGDSLRIMAALNSQTACIRCHEDYGKGEFMGAFVYDLKKIDVIDKTVKGDEKSPLALFKELNAK